MDGKLGDVQLGEVGLEDTASLYSSGETLSGSKEEGGVDLPARAWISNHPPGCIKAPTNSLQSTSVHPPIPQPHPPQHARSTATPPGARAKLGIT